jgi:hypothetical protein
MPEHYGASICDFVQNFYFILACTVEVSQHPLPVRGISLD